MGGSRSRQIPVDGEFHRRDHVRRRADGSWRLKVPYGQAEARERAESLQTKNRSAFRAYLCPQCLDWHVGRQSNKGPNQQDVTSWIELGERVCAHLRLENPRVRIPYRDHKLRLTLQGWSRKYDL